MGVLQTVKLKINLNAMPMNFFYKMFRYSWVFRGFLHLGAITYVEIYDRLRKNLIKIVKVFSFFFKFYKNISPV